MKNKKTCMKLLLDLAMLVIFVLLLHKMNFGVAFHEIAGLSVLGAFLLHLAWNWRWLYSVTKKFFSKNMRFRARLSWLLDFSLLVCFAIIGITGILISKVVFPFSVPGNWKTLHYFCTALAMILLGVHIGLHGSMIGSTTRNVLHLPPKIAKILCICLTVAMVVLGTYSISTDSFGSWLSMPFQTQATMPEGFHWEIGQEKTAFSEQSRTENAQKNDSDQQQDEGTQGEGKFSGREGIQKGRTGSSNVLLNSLKGFSIVYLFATITALLNGIVLRKAGGGQRRLIQTTVM